MVAPERRTPEHVQEILGSWLEHGELSTVTRRQKARYRDQYRRTDRAEQSPPMDGHHEPIECAHTNWWKAGKGSGSDGAGI
jgi:hypothetical protein